MGYMKIIYLEQNVLLNKNIMSKIIIIFYKVYFFRSHVATVVQPCYTAYTSNLTFFVQSLWKLILLPFLYMYHINKTIEQTAHHFECILLRVLILLLLHLSLRIHIWCIKKLYLSIYVCQDVWDQEGYLYTANSYSISHPLGTVTSLWLDSDCVVTVENCRQNGDWSIVTALLAVVNSHCPVTV